MDAMHLGRMLSSLSASTSGRGQPPCRSILPHISRRQRGVCGAAAAGKNGNLFSDKFWESIDGNTNAGKGAATQQSKSSSTATITESTAENGAWEDASFFTGDHNSDDEQEYDDDGQAISNRGGGGRQKRLPAEMRCFDTARIYVKGGDGGRGCVAFRREKFVARGGPAGGDGGRGGSVWVVADEALNSLQSFRRAVHRRADPGTPGGGSDMHGRKGEDLLIQVPVGTIVRARDAAPEDAPLAELLEPGQKALLVTGGRGGRGNASFKTARNTAPAIAERGEEGEEAWVDLELKVVADVGIVGVPNAGKSTLLSVVSAARPKIANYPFTTLVPNLGVCEMDFRTTVFADVPGLLEGAHTGVGLGHEFLRHCQRCRVLVHVIDGSSRDPLGDWHAINTELVLFNEQLADKRQVIAYNKVDLPDSGDYFDDVVEWLTDKGVAREDIFPISAATGQGVVDLVRRVRAVLDELPVQPLALETNAINATEVRDKRSSERLDEFSLEVDDTITPPVYFVTGAALERFTQMTNWDYYESLKRFQSVLQAAGVTKALRAAGVKEGDTVVIGDMEMEWSDDQSDAALYDRWENNQRAMGKPGKGMARWPHRAG